jgi:hypothetical protein
MIAGWSIDAIVSASVAAAVASGISFTSARGPPKMTAGIPALGAVGAALESPPIVFEIDRAEAVLGVVHLLGQQPRERGLAGSRIAILGDAHRDDVQRQSVI